MGAHKIAVIGDFQHGPVLLCRIVEVLQGSGIAGAAFGTDMEYPQLGMGNACNGSTGFDNAFALELIGDQNQGLPAKRLGAHCCVIHN